MIKINKLEIENVKRVKATKFDPADRGLTVIGGKNGQGKTSVLDAIAWALGGDRYRPSHAERDGSVLPPYIHVVMSNGLVVERKGKNSDLKVMDPNGNKGGQQLLNEFVEELALNLPKFMQSNSREKADTLLKIIGVGDQLRTLELQEQELYNKRHAIGQIADQKEKFAKEMTYYPDAPKEPISAIELIHQQQDILARNGSNQQYRNNLVQLQTEYAGVESRIADLTEKLKEQQDKKTALLESISAASKTVAELRDESTAEIEQSINTIELTNRQVRANLDKDKAEEDALQYKNQYDALSKELDDVRQAKTNLLQGADLPLPGLSVADGELLYNGYRWDGMSGADQLKVATAIVRKLNPKCGFVLLDKLEQMDMDTLREFGEWLEKEGLQAIATRVSTGDECSIILSDGYAISPNEEDATTSIDKSTMWKPGEF